MKVLQEGKTRDWFPFCDMEAHNEKTSRQKKQKERNDDGSSENILSKDKTVVSVGDELVFKNDQTKQTIKSRRTAKNRNSTADSSAKMTETIACSEGNNIDEAVYWLSQPRRIPSASQTTTLDGDMTLDEDTYDDLAATPTPQRPIIPKSLIIPETVDENSLLVTHANTKTTSDSMSTLAKFSINDEEAVDHRSRFQIPANFAASQQTKAKHNFTSDCDSHSLHHRMIRSSSSAASSPRADSISEDDFSNTILPHPASRIMSSSPPGGPGSVAVRRGSSGGVLPTVVTRSSAGKPLRMSSSATHLPMLQGAANNQSQIVKCSSPYFYNNQHHHPHYQTMLSNSQISDSESMGSADSMQDLSILPHSTMASTSNFRLHRQFSSGVGSAFYPIRGSLASTSVTSILSSSPSNSVCSVRTSLTQQAINNHLQQAAVSNVKTNQPVSVGRSFSNNLFEDDLVNHRAAMSDVQFMAKHLNTEKVVSKHSLKGRLSKFQRLSDKAFALIDVGTEEAIVEGCGIVAKIMTTAWVTPKIGHDLAYGLCDYLKQMSYFDLLLNFFLHTETKHRVRLASARALEECLSAPNRHYIAATGDFALLDRFVETVKSLKNSDDDTRVAVSLLESMFKHSSKTNAHLIELSALEFVLNSCKTAQNAEILKHAALALSNLSIYSDSECQQKMISKNVPDWLFFLASSRDDVTRYYACFSACILVSNKEIESAVIKSGTLALVEPFLMAHKPEDFATSDYKNIQGRPRGWLETLVPVLNGKRRESRSMAAFHFAMEAGIKKNQERIEMFHEIGAVDALRLVAALPEDVAPKWATMALEIIGEEVPHKLSSQVPLWSVDDVQYWVTHIGFEKYAQAFGDQRVDGDLLLLLGESELEDDIGMDSGLLRRRFMRELEGLKMAADYSCCDETQLDRFLVSIDPHFSIYSYQLLELGVDRSMLPSMTDDMLKNACAVENPVHRLKMMKAIQEFKHIDDMEVALLSKHIDIFISYRRSTGNQLASLIKVLLQLRGYKVFIDVDRLYAGKFDCSLLKNIQAAKHFILVLTPQSLDRCVQDEGCNDWLHKELLCALECNKNIIPVFDPQFDWPDESRLPSDVRAVTRFNGVRWVHEYQEACVDKLEKFIEGELNIDRGIYPSTSRPGCCQLINYRAGSKTDSVASPADVSDIVLEALTVASRSRASSQDQVLNGHRNILSPVCFDSTDPALQFL